LTVDALAPTCTIVQRYIREKRTGLFLASDGQTWTRDISSAKTFDNASALLDAAATLNDHDLDELLTLGDSFAAPVPIPLRAPYFALLIN